MSNSNRDCVFHPTDDTAAVQRMLDEKRPAIKYMSLRISGQLVFTSSTYFQGCSLYIDPALIGPTSKRPWYIQKGDYTENRFISTYVAYGKALYYYDGLGNPTFQENIDLNDPQKYLLH